MKKNVCMIALASMCLVACGNKTEVKEVETQVVETQVVVEETPEVETDVEEVDTTVDVEETEANIEVPEITGELATFNISGREITFGKTTVDEMDELFNEESTDTDIDISDAFAYAFGIPDNIDSDKLGYKLHTYNNGALSTFGITLLNGETPIIGFTLNNDTYTIDEEFRTLTLDELINKFGNYSSNEEGKYIWNNDDYRFSVVYDNGFINEFTIVSKQMTEFVAPYFKERIDTYKLEVELAKAEEDSKPIESKNNLVGEINDIFPSFTVGDYNIVINDTILVRENDLDEYLREVYGGYTSTGFNGYYTITYSNWSDDGNAIVIAGSEIENSDSDNDEIAITIKSVGMSIQNPEEIDIEEFKNLELEYLKESLGTPFNDGQDLVWENDKFEVRVTVDEEQNYIRYITVTDLKYARDAKEAESFSFEDIDFVELIDSNIVDNLGGLPLENYKEALIDTYLDI